MNEIYLTSAPTQPRFVASSAWTLRGLSPRNVQILDTIFLASVSWAHDAATLIGAVGRATDALARYDGLLRGMVNADVMLSPLTTQEAVMSSRIEGTQATVGDVLGSDAGEEFDAAKNADVEEVISYRQAMREAAISLRSRPISLALVRSLHQILMTGVRGQDKEPGSFRAEQNWIGPKGCVIDNANFVPPAPMILMEHLPATRHHGSR